MSGTQRIVGVDIARRQDYAAAVHLAPRRDGPGWRVAYAEQIPHSAEYGDLAAYVAALADDGVTVVVDATGVGAPVVEQARKGTTRPVWAATIHGGYTSKRLRSRPYDLSLSKRGLIARGQRALSSGACTIPPDAPGAARLLLQLRAIGPVRRKGRTPALEARVGHDDVACGWMLAVWMT